MSEGFVIANFKHVADGLQEGQFSVGERKHATGLDDLDPIGEALPASHVDPLDLGAVVAEHELAVAVAAKRREWDDLSVERGD